MIIWVLITVSNSFRSNDRKKRHKKCTKTTNRLTADIGKTVFTWFEVWSCFGTIKEDSRLKSLLWVRLSTESFSCCLLSNRGSIFTTITVSSVHVMMFAFASKKQVSNGLLTGDHTRAFSLSNCELHLDKSKRDSRSGTQFLECVHDKFIVFLDSKFDHWNSILDSWDSRLDPRKVWESRIKSRVTINLLLSGTVCSKLMCLFQ